MNGISFRSLGVLAGITLTLGCGDDSGGGGGTSMPVTISFAAQVNGTDFVCGDSYDLGANSTPSEIRDLRVYISNVRLVDGAGAEAPVTIEDDGMWQAMGTALLDFEDGCGDAGTPATNTSIRGTVAEGDYTGLRFDMGVPFEANHQDTSQAAPPFNMAAMQWNWQSGYKFIRVDTFNATTQWNLHTGTTGCESADPTEPPSAPCSRDNRPRVDFPDFDTAVDTVVVDVGEVLAMSDVSFNTPMTPPGCMAFPLNAENCAEAFPRLGLDFATGDCINNCAGQLLFHAP